MASSSTAWTEEEQQLLEEGLMKFAMICDIKEKWKAIAGHVGTRDVRACADRFKVCRQRALEQQRALEEQEEQEEQEEESEWRQSDWNEWKKDDWWNGWWSGWQDRSWKEEAPLEEADRRKWEIQQEIEANRRKLEEKEEQKRQHETKREEKLRAEREQKEKERQEQQKAREQKIIEAQEREKQQRLEEEKRQRELQRKMEEEDAKAGFYGTRHLNLSGKQGKGKGRAWGKGPSKGELQKQRREEEMERRAREVLANIGAKTTESPEVEHVEASRNDSEPQTAATSATPDVPSKAKGAKGKGGDTGDAGDRESVDLKGGKGKGKGGKGGKGKGKERRRPGWWSKIDGDCPISLVPIAELPVPPFGLKAEGSSVPHYFDGQFLASFLLSSFDFINPVNRTPLSREDCSALDAHLRDFYPSQSASVMDAFDLFQRNGGTGSDAVRREATAVFQHLFRFTHAQNMDSRGRAINFNDGGLTVIDDDDIRVTAAQHAVASTAQALAERDEVPTVPVDTGPVPSTSTLRGPSGAWAKASRPQPTEEFPALPGAKAKAGSKAKAKAGSKAASKAKATPARGLVVPKTWAKPN